MCVCVAFLFVFSDVSLGQISASELKKPSAKATKIEPGVKGTTEALGGAERYQTFVSTDKPIYRGAETVYVRGVVLNAANHKPLPEDKQTHAAIQIKGFSGETIASGNVQTENGAWGFSWSIPSPQAGGQYTAVVRYPESGYAPAERKFDIRTFRAPRLKSQIVFLRDGYGPGDKVTASLDVKRAEGGAPVGAKVTVQARVDGTEIDGGTTTVDSQGTCSVSFDLPKTIARGEGTLALIIADGGVVETASKTIPILLQTVDLKLYPEGGDLICGYKNRVYIQAYQPDGKPADLACKLMLKNGASSSVVSEFRTEHEGRGRFEFTPQDGRDYYVTVSEPTGIKTEFPLPKNKAYGAVIRTEKDIFRKGELVSVKVGCTQKHFKVTLAKREAECAIGTVERAQQQKADGYALQTVSFDTPPEVDGVLTVTVWDDKGVPLAERLIFRQPAKPINVSITPGRKTYVPGDCAKVTVRTTDSDGQPVSAVVGLTVTDDSVLEMIEKREMAPRLPVMVFLEPEVKDLADAQVYLDYNNSKAAIATDLLLGTQGWRRFALMDVARFLRENGDQAKRVLALKGSIAPPVAWNGVSVGHAVANVGALAGRSQNAFEFGQGFRRDGSATRQWELRGRNSLVGGMGLPSEIARLEGPRDTNFFQVEPTVLDERHYSSGRAERHQKTSPTLPEGVPIPDNDGDGGVQRFTFFPQIPAQANRRIRQARLGEMGGAPVVIVREFANPVRVGRSSPDRVDFTETLYWNAGVKTDEQTGEATVSFGLNDSVTSFKVFADAYTADGAVGTGNASLQSVQPFYVEAKVPLEVTSGDHILLPLSMVNGTDGDLTGPNLNVSLDGDSKLLSPQKTSSELGAGARIRWLQPIDVGTDGGVKDLKFVARAGSYSDKVLRKLSIKPCGFPVENTFAGIVGPGQAAVHTITIPGAISENSLSTNIGVFPTPLANLTSALERMIQDPNGCFEQTCSTSYPLTMAQQYFTSHAGVDPKLVESSREKLEVGYKKLVSFWCPDRGYEWFGQDPGHEALTAFGLLHFTDMEQVRAVDKDMIATTRAWLLKQKDGRGGFTRKRRALHTWIEDKDCSNAYICWALLETGSTASDLAPELASLKTAAFASKNNYVVALAANALYLASEKDSAKKLMDRLAAGQSGEGSIANISSSIVGSGGESLQVEGVSLATLAWLRDPAYVTNVEKSIKFLADSCKAGKYGSTQATVLALRAIVQYDKLRAHPKAAGTVRITVDGEQVGDAIAFDDKAQGAIKLPDISSSLTPGVHKVEIAMDGGSPMPYSFAAKYHTLTPTSDKDCKLTIAVNLAQTRVLEGASTEAEVTVSNEAGEVVPNPVAVVGLPGGMEPRHDQLKELIKKGKIDAYEVNGSKIVLYWRTLPKDAKVSVSLSVIAAVPGTYRGPASCAYLYYTDEHKKWVDGLQVEIAAK
jgi:uncharacterized protein YfaS (alpha-2-macroglobulin family)